MNTNKWQEIVSRRLTWFLLVIFLAWAGSGIAAEDEKFPLLQVGAQTYTNVTVTTKSKNYVFILHSTGIANIKVTDLTPELRGQLGYQTREDRAKISGANAVNWVREKAASLNIPQVRAAERQIEQTWQQQSATTLPRLQADPKLAFLALAGALLLYLFFCNCNRLICEKTNNEPGILIWLPILQVFPMLRAASMSPAWFLAGLVPILNLVAAIVWCFKIAKARGKSAWVGFFLSLPGISLFAYLYLAFSDGVVPKEKPVIEVMCLETA